MELIAITAEQNNLTSSLGRDKDYLLLLILLHYFCSLGCVPVCFVFMGIRKYYSNMEEIGRKATTVQTRALLRLESPSAVHWPIENLQHHAAWTATHSHAAFAKWGCSAAYAALHCYYDTVFFLALLSLFHPSITDVDRPWICSISSGSFWSLWTRRPCRLTLQLEAVFPSQMLRLAGFVCFTGVPSHRVDRHDGL